MTAHLSGGSCYLTMSALQRNQFIDFLKGTCIIWVVLTHNLPQIVADVTLFPLWGSMAVPLFLTLQSYHVFNGERKFGEKEPFSAYYDLKKLWHRIVKPFLIITIAIGLLLLLAEHSPLETLKKTIIQGGLGPGSYYVWIYLQFFLLLPVCLKVIKLTGGGKISLLSFVILSQLAEWVCMITEMPEFIYRLTAFRYLFLIFLGYIWTKTEIQKTISTTQTVAAIFAGALILMLHFTDFPLRPLLHDSAWRIFHWPCYFYAAFFLPWLLRKLFEKMPKIVTNTINEIGRYSYEIFLLQMLVFTAYPHSLLSSGNKYIDVASFIVISTIASVVPVIVYKRLRAILVTLKG